VYTSADIDNTLQSKCVRMANNNDVKNRRSTCHLCVKSFRHVYTSADCSLHFASRLYIFW